MRKLSECREGDRIKIIRIKGEGTFRRRLLEMGFTKGSALRIVKYAPLKDPMEVEIKGYRLSLRVREAEMLEVDDINER